MPNSLLFAEGDGERGESYEQRYLVSYLTFEAWCYCNYSWNKT